MKGRKEIVRRLLERLAQLQAAAGPSLYVLQAVGLSDLGAGSPFLCHPTGSMARTTACPNPAAFIASSSIQRKIVDRSSYFSFIVSSIFRKNTEAICETIEIT